VLVLVVNAAVVAFLVVHARALVQAQAPREPLPGPDQ
jgi:hypothetical protein